MRNCILAELVDGTHRAYSFPDETSAEQWYDECRAEWNAGRVIVFHRPGGMSDMYAGDDVAHLELVSRDDVEAREIDCRSAVTFG